MALRKADQKAEQKAEQKAGQKVEQKAKLSDNGNLPAYISIIEFSHPKALFNDKKTL